MPVRCEIGGAAGGGGERAELAGGGLAFRFREIVIEGAGGDFGDFREDGGFQLIALLRLALRGNGDETVLAGIDPCPGGDFEGELALLPEVEVEAGCTPAPENGGEEIVGRCVRVVDGRGFPGKTEAAGGDVEGIEALARADLRGIVLQVRLGAGDDFAVCGEGGDEGARHCFIEIPGDDDVGLVRGVACAVVVGQIRVGDFIKEMAVADDRMTACIYVERSR